MASKGQRCKPICLDWQKNIVFRLDSLLKIPDLVTETKM